MKPISTLLAVLMIVALASISFARGAPTNTQAAVRTEQAIMVQAPAPIVIASIPPLSNGFDVIQNLTNVAEPLSADTSAELRQSPAVAERTLLGRMPRTRKLIAPAIVLLR